MQVQIYVYMYSYQVLVCLIYSRRYRIEYCADIDRVQSPS